jgi:hypothetical protein
MGKKPVVKLRVYRGRELNYDQNGKVKNENHLVSLEHKSRNWVLFLKNLKLNGYCKVEVEKAFDVLDNGYREIKDLKTFAEEVKNAFNSNIEKELTPEQKRIADLEAKLESFMNNNSARTVLDTKNVEEAIVVEEKPNISDIDDERKSVVDEYINIVGKRPFGGWDIEKIKEKQAEFLAENK